MFNEYIFLPSVSRLHDIFAFIHSIQMYKGPYGL